MRDDLRRAPVHRGISRTAREHEGRQARSAHLFGGEGHLKFDGERAALPVGGIIEIRERSRVARGARRHGRAERRKRLRAHDPRADAGEEILGEERPQRLIFPCLDVARRPVVEKAIAGDMLARFADQISARMTTAAMMGLATSALAAMGLWPVPEMLVVGSVVLVTRRNNLKKITRVALDDSSRTSVALAKIIFREFLGFEPEWKTSAPDLKSMLAEADAALIIGDPAMKVPRDQFRVFDLAALWHDYTGFGFVFAMWMAGKNSAAQVQAIDFKAVRDEGLAGRQV